MRLYGPGRGIPGWGKGISKGLEGDPGGLGCLGGAGPGGSRWPSVNAPKSSVPLSSELSAVNLGGLKPVQCGWVPGVVGMVLLL